MSISGLGAASALFSVAGAARLNASPAAAPTGGVGGVTEARKTARDEFMEFAQMTPAERMRAAMLQRLGLKEEDLAAMSPEDREAVEEKLKAMIKEQVENDPDQRPGRLADVRV